MNTCFCFDLDGTVTRREILPAIASEIGLTEEMALLTDLTIRGLIPFEMSFRLRCRLLRDVPLSRIRAIVDDVPLDPAIQAFIHDHRDRCMVITGNLDLWVSGLLDRLGCESAASVGLAGEDRLESVAHVLRKDQPVRRLRDRGVERIVAVGEGFNDVPLFQAADIGIAFGGVHPPVPEIVQLSRYVVFRGHSLCRLLKML